MQHKKLKGKSQFRHVPELRGLSMCLQLMPILGHQAAQKRVQFLQPFPRLQFLSSQIELLDRGALVVVSGASIGGHMADSTSCKLKQAPALEYWPI